MNSERDRQRDELSAAALQQEPAERIASLDTACASDAESGPAVKAQLQGVMEQAKTPELAAETAIDAMPATNLGQEPDQNTNLSSTDLMLGQRIGHYQLLRELGSGGMGKVFLAEDLRLQRRVALKLLPTSFTGELERVRRFQREARAASALNHPNILTIFDLGQEQGWYFIATEYVEGQTLRPVIESGAVQLGQALEIIAQVASALDAAHQAGIIHRDIKPENLMLRPDGYVKVLDFGLAKLTEQVSGSEAADDDALRTRLEARPFNSDYETKPGVVMGTISYMSPEQANGHKVDARTDLFSLGVVLYELLAGRRPFIGATRNHVLVAILDQEPPPLAADTPAVVQRMVSRLLTKDRNERYASAAELVADLKQAREELSLEQQLLRHTTSGAQQVAKNSTSAEQFETASYPSDQTNKTSTVGNSATRTLRPHRRALLLTVCVLIALAVGALAGYFLWPRADSIAVLPFVNTDSAASDGAEREYLADGLTESLIQRLSRLPNLKVIARSSVFQYKGKEVDPRAVSETLDVRTLLLGRIKQNGPNGQRGATVTLDVELVEARSRALLWGEKYEVPVGDLPTVQNDIANRINERLRLGGSTQQRPAGGETSDPEAYQLYLKGRYYFNQRTSQTLQQSLDFYQQALAKDPNYARAYAGLAEVHTIFSTYTNAPPRESAAAAKRAAAEALQREPQLAEAHAALAHTRYEYDWDWAGAEAGFRRAIALNPNYATAHHWYGLLLGTQGRFDEAMAEMQRARELDPVTRAIASASGLIFYYARQYDRALQQFQRARELNPDAPGVHRHLGLTYSQLGRHAEAIAELQQATRLSSDNAEMLAGLGLVYVRAGQRAEAQQVLQQLQTRAQQRPVWPSLFAELYAALGERDQAFAWYDKALETREEPLAWIKVSPQLASLHGDPRYDTLLRRLGLAGTQARAQ
jgi:eukaryotic-like serine/threonine-protein kinase